MLYLTVLSWQWDVEAMLVHCGGDLILVQRSECVSVCGCVVVRKLAKDLTSDVVGSARDTLNV